MSLFVNEIVTRGTKTAFARLYPLIFDGPCRIVRAPAELFEIVRDGGGNELPTAGSGSSNRIELPALAFSKPSYVGVLLEGRAVSAPAGGGPWSKFRGHLVRGDP